MRCLNDAGRGWWRFPADDRSQRWADAAAATGRRVAEDPAQAHWWRHGKTWFAGVNALPNRPDGSIGDIALAGPAIDWLGWQGPWDAGQVSIVRPGYPARDPHESAAAHRFRRNRDAAHVDGLLPVGPDRRRMAREYHAFILGLPVAVPGPGSSPLVVWEGSHRILQAAFRAALQDLPPETWPDRDLTAIYHDARRRVFETCRRVAIEVRPGEAYVVHRMALHGIAPWTAEEDPASGERMVIYFRPATEPRDWLLAP